jgi:hypothetical protein
MNAAAAGIWTHSDYLALLSAIGAIAIGIAVVVATFRGPIVASRQADDRRLAAELRQHRMQVFRLMMGPD